MTARKAAQEMREAAKEMAESVVPLPDAEPPAAAEGAKRSTRFADVSWAEYVSDAALKMKQAAVGTRFLNNGYWDYAATQLVKVADAADDLERRLREAEQRTKRAEAEAKGLREAFVSYYNLGPAPQTHGCDIKCDPCDCGLKDWETNSYSWEIEHGEVLLAALAAKEDGHG